MADNTAEIERLRAILREGVTTVSVGGTTTTVDLNVIRQQLRDLERTDDIEGSRKPRISSIDVGGLMGGSNRSSYYGDC
ncbi:MAG: hypothetical protein JSS49_30475 [Planctomycetes bacterium]|nr:hypothetical protein [Planctomycetota bacterium]